MRRPLVELFWREVTPHLADAGYTVEQIARVRGQIGDGHIIELILKYGPDILRMILALLAIFAAKEPPAATVPG